MPFRGPSGKLLRSCLDFYRPEDHGLTYGFTNLLACRPFLGQPAAGKNRAPAPDEIIACRPRLLTLIEILKPILVVTLGRVPKQWMMDAICMFGIGGDIQLRSLAHPAYIVRPGAHISLEQYGRQVASVFEEALEIKQYFN